MWVYINFLLTFFILNELHMNEFDKSVVIPTAEHIKSDKLAQIDAWNLYNSQAVWWLTDVHTNTLWKCLLDSIFFLLALPQNVVFGHALWQTCLPNQTLVWIMPATFFILSLDLGIKGFLL